MGAHFLLQNSKALIFFKENLSLLGSLFLGLLSVSIVLQLRPDFSFSIPSEACDSWYYFATTYLFDLSYLINPDSYYYYNDRLPGTIPRAAINYLFEFPFGRYLYIYSIHILSLIALRKIFLTFASEKVALIGIFLYAFSPLVMGAYHTDYIAVDTFHFSLWTFYFLLASNQKGSVSKENVYCLLAGVFFGLAFHTHFKIGIYSFFMFVLILAPPFEFKLYKYWVQRILLFVGGFFLITTLMAIFNKFVLGGNFLFFSEQIYVAFQSEEGYARTIEALGAQSPGLFIYALIPIFYILLLKKQKRQTLVLGCLYQFLFVLCWLLFGGNTFVESNYIWSLTPALTLLVMYLNSLSMSKKQYCVLAILCVLGLGLFFSYDTYLVLFAFENLGFYYPFVFILGVLGFYFVVKKVTFKFNANTHLLVPMIPILMVWFLVRPDWQYGEELFKSDVYDYANSAHYKKVVGIAGEISEMSIDRPMPMIFGENEKDPVLQQVQNTFVQCGPHHRPSFKRIASQVKVFLTKGSYLFYLTKSKSPKEEILKKLLFAGIGVEYFNHRVVRSASEYTIYQFRILGDYNNVNDH